MEGNIMFLSFLKNKIIKNIISILLIIILLFDIIAPQLIINSYSIPSKNIKQEEYFEEYFSFKVRDRDVSIKADLLQFQSIGVPIYRPEFLVGIINVDYDNDPISKTIARCSFLGMSSNEIINEIKNKHVSRIKTMEIYEYGKKRIVNTYEYCPDNENKIIAILDDLFIQREAKGGIAVILPVVSSTIKNETIIHNAFILKSKCINDNTENLGIIRVDRKNFTLPNSINLLRNKEYQIKYYPIEGYEFDHWKINGGKLVYPQNSSYNVLFIQNDYGEIIAYYRKIGIKETSTTSPTTTSLKTSIFSSSIKIQTQSISTSSKIEIKTTPSLVTLTSSIKKEENIIDKYIVTPIEEYIIKPIIKHIIEPINEYIIKPFTKYIIEPILKYVIQPFIEYIIKPIIEIIIKIIEIIKNIIKIILDFFGWIVNTITGQNKEVYTTSQIFTSYTTKLKTYEITKSIEERTTYKEYSISYEKTLSYSNKFIISYETKINTIFITKTIKTIGNKEIITTYPIITTIYENPYVTTITTSNTITKYETSSTSISTIIPKKVTTIYEKTTTIINTEEPITTYKQITTTITTSSLTSSKLSSNIITTKASITTEIPSFKTETIFYTIKGFTTTYKTALYTYTTTVKKTTTTSKNYGGGGGGPKGPLLRDSLLSNQNIYKEFLKKIEENSELPLLYLVYKITPLRIKQVPSNYYKELEIYKINIIIKNYDNIKRKFIISTKGTITNEPYGFFLIKPNIPYYKYSLNSILENEKYSYEADIRSKIEIELKAGETKNEEIQIFFLESGSHSLSLFINDKLIDREPEYREYGIISQFWKGFFNAIRDKSPSIAIQIGLISAISLTTGGTGAIATVNSMLLATAFLLKLQSATIEAINIYEAYNNINTLNDIINKYEYLSNIAKEKKLNDTYNYLKEEENIKRNEILRILGNLGLDLFLNIDFNKFSIAIGIEKAKNEYEKGYATGETIASIINIFSFIAIQASISKLNNYLNKGSLWNVIKDSLKAWISPNIQDLAIIAKNKIKEIPSEKINNLLEKIAIIGLIFKSDIAKERIKKDLDPLLKDLTEEKIKENPFLIDEAINKIDKYCSLLSIAEIGEGRGKDFIGNILKLSGDIYGITGDLEFTKDTFEALEKFPKPIELAKYGFPNDPIKISYDYLSDEYSIQALKNGWNVLGENDYKKLFKIFIGLKTLLRNKERVEGLTNAFNDYLNSKNKEKINILLNTLDFTYNIRESIDIYARGTLYDHTIRFLNNWDLEYTKKLDDDTLRKINSIINNFKKIEDANLAHNRFIHIDNLFYDHVLIKDENEKIIGIDKDLFNDWINKVLITSSSKDEFPVFMGNYIEGEREKYYTYIRKGVLGEDATFVGLKYPIKIGKNKINGYIPLKIIKDGLTTIPESIGSFLVENKYVPGKKGFIIVSTNVNNGKIFAPTNVESGYKIAFLEWVRKALAIFPRLDNIELSDYVELEDSKLIVDWEGLIEKGIALKVTIVKLDGTIVADRYILFEPDPQTIRIGLGSENCKNKGVDQHSTVLVIFDFVKMEDIKDYEAARDMLNAYGSVMKLREIDVANVEDESDRGPKGLLGEYRICQIILKNTPKDTIEDIHMKLWNRKEGDIETTKHLIEVKYWGSDKTVKLHLKGLINQLKNYKDAIMNDSKRQGKKVVLAFYKKLSEGAYNKVIEEINNNFEDWRNWLTICNGNYEFEEFIINEYKY